MTIAAEETRIRGLLDVVEKVESVSATMDASDDRRSTLTDAVQALLAQMEPVRVDIAARLLHLSDKSVRAWAREGVLLTAAEEPRLLLDPVRLHEVMHLINDLRAAGKRSRHLLDLVWYRLSDQALLDRTDLQESLAQMARGEGRLLFDEFGQSTKET